METGSRAARVSHILAVKKSSPASSPEAYVANLQGWRRGIVEHLRAGVLTLPNLEERIKWGHLVYFSNGPALLIRAEEARILLGFWRGQKLRDIDARLKPGGKYEMATIVITENDDAMEIDITALVSKAIDLNQSLGDPTDIS